MTDEKKPTIRSYKVLRPMAPTQAEFEAGQRFAKYVGLGEYQAADPDEAVEKACEEFTDLEGGRFVVVALTGWQEREATAETITQWAITRPAPEISEDEAEQIGEGEPPTEELGATEDEDPSAVEQAAAEAAESA
jgi:hypothetical protein